MVTEAIQEFRDRLARERERILRTVAQTDEELATLERHQPGAPTEDVAVEMTGAILSRLEGQEKHELDEIDAARARLEAGAFGACEACNRPIPLVRLRARPTARYCQDCQARLER
ncbi:MAG: TraR/DksA family transcriptional regulator [Candidatus Rokubacteria bacterium]|nr:TraR/DksA family transcriptional regulator [Candidatus Rokubacteria bacterium]